MPKLLMFAATAAALAGCPTAAAAGRRVDPDLAAAEAFVDRSDRYLHQSKLTRGMKGYGLTIMAGTKVEKFEVTVISVMRDWYPHQDVVLCRLGGLGLERAGIVSGMSGSPVFMPDPADGKAKMIGAVAYGWRFQKDAMAGVQPISQMLAIHGVPLPGRKRQAAAKPVAAAGAELDDDFVRAVLDPRKVLFADRLAPPGRRGRSRRGEAAGLRPLALPVMISSATDRTMQLAEKLFEGTGMIPVRAGAVAAAEAEAAAGTKLVPGGARTGDRLFLNIIRVLSPAKGRHIHVWSPDSTVHEPDRFGEIILE